MYTHQFPKRVLYSETDRMGYMFYGHYANLYEIGRVEWLRSIGITYKDMEDVHKIMLPVVSMQSRFVRPAYYDELLNIVTTLRQMPNSFITFHTEIFNMDKKLVNAGTVRLCFVDMNTNKVADLPEFIEERLRPYFV